MPAQVRAATFVKVKARAEGGSWLSSKPLTVPLAPHALVAQPLDASTVTSTPEHAADKLALNAARESVS